MGIKESTIVIFAILMIVYAGLIASSYAVASDPMTSDLNFMNDLELDYLDWIPTSFQDPTAMSSSDTNYSFASDPLQSQNSTTDILGNFLAFINTVFNYVMFLVKFMAMLLTMPVGYFVIFKAIGLPYILVYPLIVFISIIHIYTIARLVLDVKGIT